MGVVSYILIGVLIYWAARLRMAGMWRKGDCRGELVVMHLYSKPLTSLCDYILFDFSLAHGGLYLRIVTGHTT